MRIFSSKVLDAEMRALGAIPQVLAASEMYQAMQTGLVDGNENTESTFYDFKLYEVQKYLTESSHGYVGYLVVANKKFWDRMSRTGIRGEDAGIGLGEAEEHRTLDTRFQAVIASDPANEAALEGIKKTGKTTVIDLTPAQREEWKKVLRKTHEQMGDRISKPLLQSIYKETGAKP